MTTFQVVESEYPAGVVDLMLWRDAEHILRRHHGRTADNMCVWCGREWPCGPRRLAERAQAAAYRPVTAPWGVFEEVTRGIRPSVNERRPARGAYPSAEVGPADGRHHLNRRSYDAS